MTIDHVIRNDEDWNNLLTEVAHDLGVKDDKYYAAKDKICHCDESFVMQGAQWSTRC